MKLSHCSRGEYKKFLKSLIEMSVMWGIQTAVILFIDLLVPRDVQWGATYNCVLVFELFKIMLLSMVRVVFGFLH